MATGTKKCRVCGKEYEYCHSFAKTQSNVFRWQKVACSYECGSVYLSRIRASRAEATVEADIIPATLFTETEDKDFDDFIESYEDELNDLFDVSSEDI